MPLEIPEWGIVLGVILSFFGGLLAFYFVNRITPIVKSEQNSDPTQNERLEYYERQLIDMKIRLDSLEMEKIDSKNKDSNEELKHILEKLVKKQEAEPKEETPVKEEAESKRVDEQKEPTPEPERPKVEPSNITEYVLDLITQRPMTSRDIQVALKRSREHTSRLMKRLYDEGLVKRNESTKPYTYSITDKGKERLEIQKNSSTAA